METNTPETDAIQGNGRHQVTDAFDHARKLERERDAARRSAEHIRTAFLKLTGSYQESIQFDWENEKRPDAGATE